jgi:hypothetical protein
MISGKEIGGNLDRLENGTLVPRAKDVLREFWKGWCWT